MSTTCSTGKICFISEANAEEALVANHAKYNYASGQGPINFYRCPVCDCYHFTSKGEEHPVLKDKAKLKQIKAARYWEDKLGY